MPAGGCLAFFLTPRLPPRPSPTPTTPTPTSRDRSTIATARSARGSPQAGKGGNQNDPPPRKRTLSAPHEAPQAAAEQSEREIITRLVEGAVIITRANEHHRDHRDRGGGTVFVLRLHAPSGQAGIFALRRALKFAGRYCGLRCLDAVEQSEGPSTANQTIRALFQLREDVARRHGGRRRT